MAKNRQSNHAPAQIYLWILSRTPTLPPAHYEAIVARLAAKGYETARIVKTVQAP